MAPLKKKSNILSMISKYLQPHELTELAKKVLFDPNYLWVVACVLLVAEIFVNVIVIWKIPYTEIDWEAYMSEVEGFLNGTYDYTKLEGATGPLVYPAGFVYIFSGLYFLTGHGTNVRLAQYIFVVFYLIMLILIFYIYQRTKLVPPYVMFFICCASYRIHSIFILRLFNDPVAMLFLYTSIAFFMNDRWTIGCLFFSLGVSIKMNVLLFAPGLLVLLLLRFGITGSIVKISICVFVQLILAIPFLLNNPVGYVVSSFNLGRQFFFKWTVNWRFIPNSLFLNRWFHGSLLVLHLVMLLIFFLKKWPKPLNGWFSIFKSSFVTSQVKKLDIAQVMFISNFIGMCFSRSLHYQFYVWYFHTLPLVLWLVKLPSVVRLLLLGLIEMSWNTYPSTNVSSATLHICHFVILVGLLTSKSSDKTSSVKEKEK